MDCEGKVITSDNSWGFSTRRNCQSSSKELLSPPAGRAVSSPADPVSLAVSPCIHLGAQSVSGRGIKKKKVSLQEISPLTAKEALSLHWQWTALCFLSLILAGSRRFGMQPLGPGWRKSLGCILFPKSPASMSLFWGLLHIFLLELPPGG